MSKQHPCTVSYYNGACPVCRSEMHRYRGHAEQDGAPLGWVDISKPENADALAHHGITQEMAYRHIYATDRDGKLQRGVDALIAIWGDIPRWRWAARLIALPLVRPLCAFLYDHMLSRAVYEWNRWRLARGSD